MPNARTETIYRTDDDSGKNVYRGTKEDGTLWETIVQWLGYRLHLVIGAVYKLPVHFSVTKASGIGHQRGASHVEQLEQKQPEMLKEAETWAADKGCDDMKLIQRLWDEHRIKPVIDIRNCWKDGEQTCVLSSKDNVVYNCATSMDG